MVNAFRDDCQWDKWAGPMRCAFKLVKLAAGTFEPAHVLDELSSQQSQPSWVSGPATTSVKLSLTPIKASSDGHRTVRNRCCTAQCLPLLGGPSWPAAVFLRVCVCVLHAFLVHTADQASRGTDAMHEFLIGTELMARQSTFRCRVTASSRSLPRLTCGI